MGENRFKIAKIEQKNTELELTEPLYKLVQFSITDGKPASKKESQMLAKASTNWAACNFCAWRLW